MQTRSDRTVDALMEQLIESGPDGLSAAFVAMLNLAMRMERERANGALAYQRSAARTAYADGCKPKRIDTPVGTLTVQVPRSRGGETPFHPQALRGVRFITSADHAGLGAARKAIGRQLRIRRRQRGSDRWRRRWQLLGPMADNGSFWNATDRVVAEAELARILQAYADSAPRLAAWLEHNVPEGLAVFSLPEPHWRRMRTANPTERAIPQELKRRTKKVRVFPDEAALERLSTAILVEIDGEWIAKDRTDVTMDNRDGQNPARDYRQQVALPIREITPA